MLLHVSAKEESSPPESDTASCDCALSTSVNSAESAVKSTPQALYESITNIFRRSQKSAEKQVEEPVAEELRRDPSLEKSVLSDWSVKAGNACAHPSSRFVITSLILYSCA